jgi:hypothetical protein
VSWLPVFLCLGSAGTLGAAAAVPFREIGKYYFTFHGTLALAAAAAGLAAGRPWEALMSGRAPLERAAGAAALLFGLAVLVTNAAVRAARKDLRRDALLFPVSAGALWAALAAFARPEPGAGQALLLAAHLWACAAVLGTSLVAMSTGHWYLSNARLSFDILVRLCALFLGALGARAAVTAAYLASRWASYRSLEEFDQLVLGVRLGAGVVLAGVLGFMALACARRRANQSATGILYVAVVFVLIGETISMYLTLGKGRPI